MLFNMTIALLVVKIDDPSFQHYIFSKPPSYQGKKNSGPPPPISPPSPLSVFNDRSLKSLIQLAPEHPIKP